MTGVVLAGGEGRRMGGGKPERVLLGKSLLEHAIALLEPLCAEVLVVGPGGIPDREPGLGPLGGLLTALEKARFPRVLVLTVDMPAVAPESLRALAAEDAPAVTTGEPFPGVYSKTHLPALRAFLAGSRRAREFARSLQPRVLHLDDPGLSCNVNTPEDLLRARAILESR